MITRDGRLKVTDFGIARVEANGVTLDGRGHRHARATWRPSSSAGEDIDHRVDLYAAAASLYQVLTGRSCRSRVRTRAGDVQDRDGTDPEAAVAGSKAPRIGAHLDAVVMRGLAKERDQRYESAGAVSRGARPRWLTQPIGDTVSEHTLIMEHGASAIRPAEARRRRSSGARSARAAPPGLPHARHHSRSAARPARCRRPWTRRSAGIPLR
jgi:serine/threonine protein kinase